MCPITFLLNFFFQIRLLTETKMYYLMKLYTFQFDLAQIRKCKII